MTIYQADARSTFKTKPFLINTSCFKEMFSKTLRNTKPDPLAPLLDPSASSFSRWCKSKGLIGKCARHHVTVYERVRGLEDCVCACLHVCVCCDGMRREGGSVWVSADVIIRPWNSENSWEGWTVLEGFLSAPGTNTLHPPESPTSHPCAAGLMEKYSMFQQTAINYPKL